MIVDTSALVAIFAEERESRDFGYAMLRSATCLVASGSWIEFATVLVRRFGIADPMRALELLRDQFALTLAATTPEHANLAAIGYARFGKGTRHPARLNSGDCFSYALAKATGEPLLFKGDNFNHTDLSLAEASSYPRG